jgi:hypothetical protein
MSVSSLSSVSSDSNPYDVDELVYDEPIFHVLSKFLAIPDPEHKEDVQKGKNIVSVLAELVEEVRTLRLTIASLSKPSSPVS